MGTPADSLAGFTRRESRPNPAFNPDQAMKKGSARSPHRPQSERIRSERADHPNQISALMASSMVLLAITPGSPAMPWLALMEFRASTYQEGESSKAHLALPRASET